MKVAERTKIWENLWTKVIKNNLQFKIFEKVEIPNTKLTFKEIIRMAYN